MSADKLSQTFAALADPTRRAMLAQLSKGQAVMLFVDEDNQVTDVAFVPGDSANR